MTSEIIEVRTEQFSDLGYTVKAEAHQYRVEFRLHRITGWVGAAPCYGNNYTSNLPDEPDLSGFVKWDGCSNWLFEPQGLMFHGCTKEDLENLGKVLAACWDLTAQMCPSWDGEE